MWIWQQFDGDPIALYWQLKWGILCIFAGDEGRPELELAHSGESVLTQWLMVSPSREREKSQNFTIYIEKYSSTQYLTSQYRIYPIYIAL